MDKIDELLKDQLMNSIPKMSEDKKNELKQKIVSQKPRRTAVICRFAVIIFLVALIPLTLILTNLNKDNTKYYADSDLTSVTLTQSDLTDILSENYSNYLTVLNETYLYEMFAFYGKEDNKLVYIKVVGFTSVSEYNFILVIENYEYSEHFFFVESSEITQNKEYKMYRKDVSTAFKEITYVLLEYHNYKFYLTLDGADEEFLAKFVNS